MDADRLLIRRILRVNNAGEHGAVSIYVDPALASLVRDIQVQENEHLAFVEERHHMTGLFDRIFAGAIAVLTEALIMISTRGDSFRLRQALA